MATLRNLLVRYSTFLILLFLVIFFSLVSSRFLTASNILNILDQSALLGVVAIGVTYTIISGGIDLSVGSLVAFVGAVSAGVIVRSGVSVPAGILLGLLVGTGMGFMNGLFVVYGRLQPFVATLAMMAIARGSTLLYTQGRPISGLGDAYTFFGSSIGPIPVSIIVLTVVVALSSVLLRRTPFGAYLYAVGGSEETTRLAGVSVNGVKLGTYAFSGLMAAIGGILLTARLWSAQPQAATGLELQAIAATVLGGASLMGGVGTTIGTVAGALIMGVLANGLNLAGVSSYFQQVITGSIFILAVLLDMWTKRRSVPT